jgi:hypothetical protein
MTALAVAVAMAAAAVPAAALDVGISDQNAAAFADRHLRQLSLREARLIVPWDAATSEPGVVQAWLDAAAAAGMAPHIAFEHLLHEKCPARACVAPSRSQYRAAVRAFVARFPQVRTYTSWNEANHESQPTASSPAAVAGYYEELRAACAGCTVVAADVIDSGSYVNWIRRFQSSVSGSPRLWGLHNYTDVTYGTTSGTDAALAVMPGEVWVEETGGIVVRRDARGRELLRYDEARAARAVTQSFTIASTRPRITRMYFYQWRARVNDYFDAGLVRPDASLRPSYTNLVAGLRTLTPSASKTTAARTTWTARWARTKARTLVVKARCAKGKTCRGSATLVLRTLQRGKHRTQSAKLGTRRYATTVARRSKTVQIRLSRKLARRVQAALRRSLALTVRDRGATARKVVLTLGRPR